MRVLFAGTPEIAVPSLKALLASRHQVCGVLTNPDKARGRGRKAAPTAVKQALLESSRDDIPILQFETLRSEARQAVADLKPDILAVFAYARIFGPRFLSLFPRGGLNIHPSKLPLHRGAAPIPATILSGDAEAAISIQKIALEMDTGDIMLRTILPLTGSETSGTLSSWASEEGGRLLVECLDRMEEGSLIPEPQDHSLATYSKKIERSDALIDWEDSALEIDRRIRAYNPRPKAYTIHRGVELYLLKAVPYPDEGDKAPAGTVLGVDRKRGILVQTGAGVLGCTRLQAKHKKALDFVSFYNGNRDISGDIFGGAL